jgi:hypothetical protein
VTVLKTHRQPPKFSPRRDFWAEVKQSQSHPSRERLPFQTKIGRMKVCLLDFNQS